MPTCPSNHESQTNDFCSVCGIEMTASERNSAGIPSSTKAFTGSCPICHTPRSSDRGDFCEECGFNFKSEIPIPAPTEQAPQPEAVVEAPAETTSLEPAAAPAEPATINAQPAVAVETCGTKPAWEVIVSVDPAIRGTAAADAPVGQPDRLYPLDRDKSIGRRSVSKSFTPDIDLANDTAVSHHQAKLAVQTNGEIALVDLDSINGTLLNRVKIPPNILHLLKDGDVIAVGGWTKIVVRKTNSS
jgi:hypothetical protein